VLVASSGEEALEIYRNNGDEISLVILDLIMAGMGGQQCLDKLLEIDPKAKILIASGYSAGRSAKEAVAAGARGFVSKPFLMKPLLRTVREILDE
jgi:DNA-binding NtrC family response regulator